MTTGRSTTRRRILFFLAAVNVVVLYLNFKVLTIDDIRNYSEELSSNLKKLRLLEYTYSEHWYSAGAAANKTDEQEEAFAWEKVSNLHLALPAYEKMRNTLSRLQDFQFVFSKRANQLSITQEMLTFKSILWRGDEDRLKDIFVDVLETNRSIKVGVLGGAISGQTICPVKACLYIDHITKWLESVLQTTVTLHNAAIPFASSDYFAWCSEPHLDLHEMDIIIWEMATDDFTMRSHLDKPRYDNAAQPQELLTRQIKSLPSRPYLMYVNFMSPESIRNRDCVNSEFYAGRHLCRHYNVTSISWSAAVCTSLWQLGFTPDELIHSGGLVTPRAHEQAAFFVINFMRGVLKKVAVKLMTLTRSKEEYLNRLVSLHDRFIENSDNARIKINDVEKSTDKNQIKDSTTYESESSTNYDDYRRNNITYIRRDTMRNTTSKALTTSHHFGTYQNFLKDHPDPLLKVRSRFPTKWIHNPICWPLSQPQYVAHHSLKDTLTKNGGWEESISERENWYTSTAPHQIIEVTMEISPPRRVNQTCTIALAVMACDYCGQALAWLDDAFDKAVLVGGKWAGHTFRVVEVMDDVKPGRHIFSLKSLEDKPFKVSAVMSAHKDRNKF